MLVDEKRLANVLTALETGGRTITLDLAADLRDARARLAALEAQAGAQRAAGAAVTEAAGELYANESHDGHCYTVTRSTMDRLLDAVQGLRAALAPTAGQHAARILALVAEWERMGAEHYAYWQSMGHSPVEREREAELRERVHDVQLRLLAAARELRGAG